MHACMLSRFSCVWLCAPLLTAAHQSPLTTGFSRQEYWSGVPLPSPMHACMLSRFSHIWLCATLWTAAHQAPLPTEFSRQEYWSGLPFPSPICLLVKVYSAYLFGWLSRGRFCVSRSLSVLSSASICGIKLFMTLIVFFISVKSVVVLLLLFLT